MRAPSSRTGRIADRIGRQWRPTRGTDDARQPLDGRCDVLVSGCHRKPGSEPYPYDPKARLVATRRSGKASPARKSSAMRWQLRHHRRPAAARATGCRPARWEKYLLVLRLYDTPVGRTCARDQQEGLLVIRVALLLAGIVHLATVLVLPRMATQDDAACPRSLRSTPSRFRFPPHREGDHAVDWTRRSRDRYAAMTASSGPLKFSVPIKTCYTSV